MYKIQVRPPSGHKLTTRNSFRYESNSKTPQNHIISREIFFPFFGKHIRLYLSLFVGCLTLVASGCGGIVWNPSAVGALTVSPGKVTFGSVPIGQKASTALTLANKSSSQVTISKIDLSGDSYSLDGGSALPVTLSSGGFMSLKVHFLPAATGVQTGKLTVTSNSSTSPTAVVSLTGTGSATTPTSLPSLNVVSCGTQSLTGPQSKACSVYLSAAATSPIIVTLASNNGAVSVPKAVTVAAGASSTGFEAVFSGVSSAQSVTLTASSGGVSESDVMQLYPVSPASSSSSLSEVSCGTTSITGSGTKACSVYLSAPAVNQTVVSLSSNNTALTVPSSVIIPSGMSSSGFGTVAAAVNSTQTVTLTASADGVTKTDIMQLLATLAPQTQHEVQLNWDAPTGSSVPIAGYRIYRSTNSNSTYQLINPSLETQTTYADTTVQGGTSYDYVVKTVDTAGAESAPSNTTAVTIP